MEGQHTLRPERAWTTVGEEALMTAKGRPQEQATSREPRRRASGKASGKVSDNQPMEQHEELITPEVHHRTPDRRVPPKR